MRSEPSILHVLWVFFTNTTMHHLIHLPLVPHKCVSELGKHWFRWWLVTCPAPSLYLSKYWLIANWTPGNNFQWNLNENFVISILKEGIWNCCLPKWRSFCPEGDELMAAGDCMILPLHQWLPQRIWVKVTSSLKLQKGIPQWTNHEHDYWYVLYGVLLPEAGIKDSDK